MPTFEVLFKVGDSNPGNHSQQKNWEDGQIIAIKPTGFWWTKADIVAWANSGTLPPGWASLPETQQITFNRMRLQTRRFLNPNFTRLYHINQRFVGEPGIPISQDQLNSALNAQSPSAGQQKIIAADAECAENETDIQARLDKINAYDGMDTNWGWMDLQHHGVVSVLATVAQLDRATDEWIDPTYNALARRRVLARTRWKIDLAAIETAGLLTAQQVADFRDRDVFVNVDRVSAPIPAGVAIAPVVRDATNNPEGTGEGEDPS